MKRQAAKTLNVLLFPQASGSCHLWIAQCTDLDFAAQGETLEEAKANFIGTIQAHVALCIKRQEKPFDGIPSAPSWFQRDFGLIKAKVDAQEVSEPTPMRRMLFKHALVPGFCL